MTQNVIIEIGPNLANMLKALGGVIVVVGLAWCLFKS